MSVEKFPAPDIAIRAEAVVGEGPVWDSRTQRFCWVDLARGLIYENDLRTGEQRVSRTGTTIGAAIPRESADGFVVAVEQGLGYYGCDELEVVEPVLQHTPLRMNDAKCDSSGRLWAGSTHQQFLKGVGRLHRWDGVHTSTVMSTGHTLPNGLGWNSEDTLMYLADSVTQQLLRAAYRPETGEIESFTEVCAVDEGLPDGLAIDWEGCIWLAIWGGWQVQRYDPAGRLIGVVPVPVERPSSCAFLDDGTLMITSAAPETGADADQQPLAGSVFALQTPTRGVPVRSFAG